VDLSGLDPRLRRVPIEVACDVTSPLVGDAGAARVFGPQKGADPAAVERLDSGLAHLSSVWAAQGLPDVTHMPRAGAAGGAAGGLAAMLGATLVDGGTLVACAAGLGDALAGADLCITGEGRLDDQTARGKAPAAVAAACADAGVPCVGLFGQVDLPPGLVRRMGLVAAFPIGRVPRPLAGALAATADDLVACAAAVVALRSARW
jgi:glycerate 2-kinase